MDTLLFTLYHTEFSKALIASTYEENSIGNDMRNLFLDISEQNPQYDDLNMQLPSIERFMMRYLPHQNPHNLDIAELMVILLYSLDVNNANILSDGTTPTALFKFDLSSNILRDSVLSERKESCFYLTLNIIGSLTLVDSLNQFFEKEQIDDILKSNNIASQPSILILQLRRYTLDFETFRTTKVKY
jgi:hypothetical protein